MIPVVGGFPLVQPSPYCARVLPNALVKSSYLHWIMSVRQPDLDIFGNGMEGFAAGEPKKCAGEIVFFLGGGAGGTERDEWDCPSIRI